MARDYTKATTRQLAAWMRQYKKSDDLHLRCEFGHDDCGCSNVATMDGNAPCIDKVEAELAVRRGLRVGLQVEN